MTALAVMSLNIGVQKWQQMPQYLMIFDAKPGIKCNTKQYNFVSQQKAGLLVSNFG
jgi:hypothetical protein